MVGFFGDTGYYPSPANMAVVTQKTGRAPSQIQGEYDTCFGGCFRIVLMPYRHVTLWAFKFVTTPSFTEPGPQLLLSPT